MRQVRAWLVGVEAIHPHSRYDHESCTWDNGFGAWINYQTENNHADGKPPHRSFVVAPYELGILVEFYRRCEKAGFVIGDPP